MAQIIVGATKFRGASRRFNLISQPESDITVIDDYAHHPTEVATTIEAAKLHFKRRRLLVVFRPHTYSRTKALLANYHQAFGLADQVYITGIEGAREAALAESISGADIVSGLDVPAQYFADRTELVAEITTQAKPGDVILLMSVSGYDKLAEELTSTLN